MAFLDHAFDVDTLPQGTGGNFEPLPDGWYQATITGAEVKDTKAGTGQYISVKYTITGPTHEGRVVFGSLNIRNPNPKAESIGLEQLRALMVAVGVPRVTDTDQLIGGNLSIKLAIRESEQYGASNDVKAFKALAGTSAAVPTAKAASATPPWSKK
jgi:hypothetical protein